MRLLQHEGIFCLTTFKLKFVLVFDVNQYLMAKFDFVVNC